MIRAVLFDVDDTLVRYSEAMDIGLAGHLRTLSPGVTEGELRSAAGLWRALSDTHYGRFLTGELTFQEQRRARAVEFCARRGLDIGDDPKEQDAWVDAYLRHCELAFRLYPDVGPTLDRLSASGVRVGVVSNSTHGYQRHKLDLLGVGHRFASIVCCDDVGGAAKPDPRIFDAGCRALGVPAASALYVGDRWEVDALGAARAGLHGVWLDRGGFGPPSEPPSSGVTTIRSLDEVADLAALSPFRRKASHT